MDYYVGEFGKVTFENDSYEGFWEVVIDGDWGYYFPECVLEKTDLGISKLETNEQNLSTNVEFKVGDEVEIIGNQVGSDNKVGDVGVIIEICERRLGAKVQVPGGPTSCNWSSLKDLKLIKSNNNIQKTASVEVNGKQIVLTLTDEQIAQITKETSGPKLIKSWEEAYELIKPEWFATVGGNVRQLRSGLEDDETNVPSKARGKSVLAYCKLSVIVEALNKTAERNYHDGGYAIFVDSGELKVDYYPLNFEAQPLILNTIELAGHLIEHFGDLLKDYFML